MYLNKAMLIGNLTRDPELKSLESGQQVASFSLATNRTFKDKDGNKKEQAEFHNVVVFGKQAESVAQYLKKGSQAYVEGRLQTRTWEKEGEKKSRTEIIAEVVQFGSRPTTTNTEQAAEPVRKEFNNVKDEVDPDAIPF